MTWNQADWVFEYYDRGSFNWYGSDYKTMDTLDKSLRLLRVIKREASARNDAIDRLYRLRNLRTGQVIVG